MIGQWHDVPWLRRTVFVALNLAACIAIFLLVAYPIDALLTERDAQIAELSATLARVSAMASRKANVDALARQVEAESDLGEFLAAANEGAANAALQARLKTMTEAVGARIRSVQGLPAKNDGQIKSIGARINLYGALGAVHKAIYAVESGKPYLFVTNASIRLSSPASAQAATTEPVIDAQLDVFGALPMESPVR
jgi:Type II secretion system (T2SS), protein M subtype b